MEEVILFKVLENYFQITRERIISDSKCKQEIEARKLFTVIAYDEIGLSFSDISILLNRTRQTISRGYIGFKRELDFNARLKKQVDQVKSVFLLERCKIQNICYLQSKLSFSVVEVCEIMKNCGYKVIE